MEEIGNTFNYKFGKLMEKHKMTKGFMFFHAGETLFDQVEMVFVGDPSIEWISIGLENLATEMQKRVDLSKIASGVRGFGDEK